MVTRRDIFQRAVGTLERSFVHQSTYGRNRLSMAAGLASLRIIERDEVVANAERMGTLLMDGLRELGTRYEMVADVRGSGLLVGIELGQPSSRTGKLNWRLIHMASGGLFPQLIVIPLHRDHNVITMAGGKNDVIKLLPALTITEDEVNLFLERFEQVLSDVHGSSSHNWGVVRQIATATLTRRGRTRSEETLPAITPPRGRRIDLNADNAYLVTGATGFIGGHLAQRLLDSGHQVRCLVRPTSDTTLLESMPVEIAVGDLTDAGSLQRPGVGLGDDRADDPDQRRRHAQPAASGSRSVGRAVRAYLQHRRVWLSGPRGRRDPHRLRLCQLVLTDQARRRTRGPSRAGAGDA